MCHLLEKYNHAISLTHLKRSSFWIAAESPDEMWIQIVRHSSLSIDYSAILFPTCSCVLLEHFFLDIATKMVATFDSQGPNDLF